MKILCDNYSYGIKEEPGDQPIRIFYPIIQREFHMINNGLKKQFNNLPTLKFSFLTENVRCIGPSCTPNKIEIHDTFLSFLWGLIYGVFVKGPFRYDKTDEEHNNAENLLDYSLNLLTDYLEWDKNKLPNPEIHDSDPKHLIAKTNVIFLYAVRFIIYHEFAHISLGHFDKDIGISQLEKEYEADDFAVTQIINDINIDNQEVSAKNGVIAALASILFFSYDVSGGNIHPDPHQRLTKILDKIDYSKNKEFFGISMWFIIDWGMKFNAYWKLWPGNYNGNMKDAYKQTLFYLENLQSERNVIIPDIEKEYFQGEKVIHLQNSTTVTIIRKIVVKSKHFNVYQVKFESGYTVFVSSDDIAREGTEMDILVKAWKNEMLESGEKSLSIGVDKTGELHCFFHTSEHYRIKKKYSKIRFKFAWGQPSY